MSFPCILLAAGASSRMGCDKLLLPIRGEPMLVRSARAALDAGCELIAVTGWNAEARRAALASLASAGAISFAHNPGWAEGMVSSAAAGLGALPSGVRRFFLHLADLPFASPEVFAALAARALELGEADQRMIAPMYKGLQGHPVLLAASVKASILALGRGERLKETLWPFGIEAVSVECPGVIQDLDSPEDYREALR